ncbi:hypothetical protein QBC44DRAFT_304003 [Cladorrhinum sp. PSN332]|nr:hypothetical protein QBC44DRAFT_304003 [Cladorrhinum sp. PSN332]
MASSSTLGLRACDMLSARSARIIPGTASWTTRCSFSTSQRKLGPGGGQTRRALDKMNKSIGSGTPSPRRSQAMKQTRGSGDFSSAAISIVFPATFVRPPLSQFPKSPGKWLRFLKHMIWAKTQEKLQQILMKVQSKPTLLKRARWQRNNSAVILTAKGLHRSMAEAFASGDKTTIRNVCTANLGTPLLAAIDNRPRTRRYGWELVEYTKKMAYPSIRASRIMPASKDPNAIIVRQVVVAIASKQRRVEYDDSARGGGRIVPGSEKELEVVENVAIAQAINPHTWEGGEWRLLGTVKPTTLEDWETEMALTKEVETAEAFGR